jgi:hypothetical protein
MSVTKQFTSARSAAKKAYRAPVVKTYGNIREITLTAAPYDTDMKDNGTFAAGRDKTLVPR